MLNQRLESEKLDVTIPGKEVAVGHEHPMYIVLDEIKDAVRAWPQFAAEAEVRDEYVASINQMLVKEVRGK